MDALPSRPNAADLYGPESIQDFTLEQYSGLFGLEVKLPLPKCYRYSGPQMQDITMEQDGDIVLRKYIFTDPIIFSAFVPGFQGTKFEEFSLKCLVISEQNFRLDALRRSSGWHIDADIVIDNSFGPLHTLLSDFFQNSNPSVHIHAELGHIANRGNPLKLNYFVLEGNIGEHNAVDIRLCDSVSVTSLGVQLNGFQRTSCDASGDLQTRGDYGFSVFGSLDFRLPAWKSPVKLDLMVSHLGDQFLLHANVNVHWDNAFGIDSLTLQSFAISTTFQSKSPFDSLTFRAEAEFWVAHGLVLFDGYLSMKGDFKLSAHVEDLHWKDVAHLFTSFCGESLKTPDFDIYLAEATITFSNDGLALEVYGLVIADNPPCDAKMTLGREGLHCVATVRGTLRLASEITLTEPYITITVPTTKSKKSANVLAEGIFTWRTHEFKIGAHVYRIPEDRTRTHVTLYGTYRLKQGSGVRFDGLLPQLSACDALKDVALDAVAVTYATRDDAQLGDMVGPKFNIKTGLYICCSIKKLGGLEGLGGYNTPADQPIFMAYLGCNKNEVNIKIEYICPINLKWNSGVTMDEVALAVKLGSSPQLMLTASMAIPIQGRPDLEIDISCSISPSSRLRLEGKMRQLEWKNPFGLCPDLTIGPHVSASFAIILASITPDGFGLAADFCVNEIKVKLDMEVSMSDPRAQFLILKIQELDLADLSKLVQKLTGLTFNVKREVVHFRTLDLSISPCETPKCPQGLRFKSNAQFCGEDAGITAIISKELVELKVSFAKPFKIGNYLIHSAGDGNRPLSFSVKVGRDEQKGAIDAGIKGPHLEAFIWGSFDMQPSPTMKLNFHMSIADAIRLDIAIDAGSDLSSKWGGRKLHKIDFKFSGHLSAKPDELDQFNDKVRALVDTKLHPIVIEALNAIEKMKQGQAPGFKATDAYKLIPAYQFGKAVYGFWKTAGEVAWNSAKEQRLPNGLEVINVVTENPVIKYSALSATLALVLKTLRVHEVYLEATVGSSTSKLEFHVSVSGAVAGRDFDFSLTLNLSDEWKLLNEIIDWIANFIQRLPEDVLKALH